MAQSLYYFKMLEVDYKSRAQQAISSMQPQSKGQLLLMLVICSLDGAMI